MQIIELRLSHDNFFCPATGQNIKSSTHYEPSPATKGAWWNEIPDEPMDLDESLAKAWEEYKEKVESEDDCLDVAEFLQTFEHDSYVCFAISPTGPLLETGWYVIDITSVP